MAIVAAFDPGIAGALCVLDGAPILHLDDLPIHNTQHGQRAKVRSELDLHALAALLRQHQPVHCFVENVSAMPKQGLASTWRFAESYGQLQGIITALGIPMTLVAPKLWQRHHQIGPAHDAARQRAVQLFPNAADHLRYKKDHNKAAALLLAAFGAHTR